MGKRTLKITIPEPCQQSWENMQPTACGAFCACCQKEVIDFTNKSEAEIVDILVKAKGEVCGNISSSNLNRPLAKYTIDKRFFDARKWAVAAGVLLGAYTAQGESDNSIKPATDTCIATFQYNGPRYTFPLRPSCIYTLPLTKNDCYNEPEQICIYGYVTNEWQKPVANAEVILFVPGIITYTDTTGFYKIFIPENVSVTETEIGCIGTREGIGDHKPVTANKTQQVNLRLISDAVTRGKMRISIPELDED